MGPAFEIVEPQQPWPWRTMLNRCDDATLTRIIGPGVTGIFCHPMGNPAASSYDHKREHHAKHCGVPFEDVTAHQQMSPCGLSYSTVVSVKQSDCTRTRRTERLPLRT